LTINTVIFEYHC